MNDKCVGVFMRLLRNEMSMHKAIKSVLNQTYSNLKYYILVSEQTRDVVTEYAKQDTRIRILENDGEKDFNFYIKEMSADDNSYVIEIDADDWCSELYIETLMKYAQEYQTDITACGYYFVDKYDNIIVERKCLAASWNVDETSQVLPYMYAFFRTNWGKLIKSRVIEQFEVSRLVSNESCGGYGTDTTYMFNLLRYAKRIGMCGESLYYYRISEMGNSYVWKQGREHSDEILFDYVSKVLEEIGEVSENNRRFLLHVYGNAVVDSVKLLMTTKMPEDERTKILKGFMENDLTQELLRREQEGTLVVEEGISYSEYRKSIYELIFDNASVPFILRSSIDIYLDVFNLLCPARSGILSREEFYIMTRKKEVLGLFVNGLFHELFETMLEGLAEADQGESDTYLLLIRRITKASLAKKLLIDKKCALEYKEILVLLDRAEDALALKKVQQIFMGDNLPYGNLYLVDVWINLAAKLEKIPEFIMGKELEIEIRYNSGDIEEARRVYSELREMGITDENMIYFESTLF